MNTRKSPDQPQQEATRLRSFTEMAGIKDENQRIMAQLKMLDVLLANAVQSKDFSAALKIQAEADKLLRRIE